MECYWQVVDAICMTIFQISHILATLTLRSCDKYCILLYAKVVTKRWDTGNLNKLVCVLHFQYHNMWKVTQKFMALPQQVKDTAACDTSQDNVTGYVGPQLERWGMPYLGQAIGFIQ